MSLSLHNNYWDYFYTTKLEKVAAALSCDASLLLSVEHAVRSFPGQDSTTPLCVSPSDRLDGCYNAVMTHCYDSAVKHSSLSYSDMVKVALVCLQVFSSPKSAVLRNLHSFFVCPMSCSVSDQRLLHVVAASKYGKMLFPLYSCVMTC